MALEAPRIGIQMRFLDALGGSSPAAQVVGPNSVMKGGLKDSEAIQKFAEGADVVTVEIEHINVDALQNLEEKGVKVRPSAAVLRTIQDKLIQKDHFSQRGIPLPPYATTPSIKAVQETASRLGLPLMLKSRKGGYDGRGNAVLKDSSENAVKEALTSLGVPDVSVDDLEVYAEGWIDFSLEVAVMVVQNKNETKSYPAVNAIQQDSICRIVLAPARGVNANVLEECEDVARRAIASLGEGAAGVFGVELFVTKQNQVLLNEVAPRPHNTGHYTQDGCAVSQFENHLRGVAGMPLGSTKLAVEAAAMVNVLGQRNLEETLQSSQKALSMDRATVHWYGKESCRKGRKMGHINLTAGSDSELDADLQELLRLEGIPSSLLPKISSPLVGVIMGSQSDLPTMQAAVKVLRDFGVSYEVDIVSAHRTPDKLTLYSRGAAGRGMRVIIAGAGGAAHLPGMVASQTVLPVIGVPVKTSTLSGVDSLYSIVQMPRGIPVATVAIGNAQNAGLLAVRMLSTSRPELRRQMDKYQKQLQEMVEGTSDNLILKGSDAVLAEMDNKSQSVNV